MIPSQPITMDTSEKFTRLWTEAQPMVSAYVAACVPDFHAAEDLLQNVAVTLLRKFDEYDASRPFIGWAIGIAKFEILRHRRRQARSVLDFRPELADELADELVQMTPELELRAQALRRCTEQLQGRSSEIVRLCYAEGLKPRQIAETLGLNSLVVRVALNRARSALRKCIERRLRREVPS
jgi:RNA polymerase sigma-70 factor (ECF subfamily)